VKEIEENACNCLKFNSKWRQHIEYAFASLRGRSQDFKSMHVEIYCPQMILETLFHACFRYLALRHTGGLAEFDQKIMNLLELEYVTDLKVKRQGKTRVYRNICIYEGKMGPSHELPFQYLEDFIVHATSFMAELIQFYSSLQFLWMS
jgi:hypothetical protein